MLAAVNHSSQVKPGARIMSTHPDLTSRLAREHHREMLADARRRQLRRQSRPAASIRDASVTRRLATAMARLGVAATRVPDAARPARP
jgi:hypothetical protein